MVNNNIPTYLPTTSWNIWWSGHKHKREYGVGIAVKSCKSITVEIISPDFPQNYVHRLHSIWH